MKKNKTFQLLFLAIIFFAHCNCVRAEDISFTTYYPSLQGVYSGLSSEEAFAVGDISDSGTAAVDETTDLDQGEVFVEDSVIFKPKNADPIPADSRAGSLIYNDVEDMFKYYDGTQWKGFTGAAIEGGGCYISYCKSPGGISGFCSFGTVWDVADQHPCREDLGYQQVGVGDLHGRGCRASNPPGLHCTGADHFYAGGGCGNAGSSWVIRNSFYIFLCCK